ncbi:hypothetical protein LN042_13745 [Kitasatospora sp. RB6PN24]|uniref:hypothetical protein n=1 Tax=Kitasatospora humi TaxID=2893891 RepID=UPI001E3A99F4|nr:hypothetical protein [Kitasatospora humi]MCC9308137.1 hypothetical protein [Kitasatospora humi]
MSTAVTPVASVRSSTWPVMLLSAMHGDPVLRLLKQGGSRRLADTLRELATALLDRRP